MNGFLNRKVFNQYKVLLGIVLFLIGFSALLLPSWLDWTSSKPELAMLIQAFGSFISATISVAFIHGVFVKEYEQKYLLESLSKIVSESVSTINCRQCRAIINKCQPDTPECTRVQNALILDDIIFREKNIPINSYDTFIEHLKQRLFESTQSFHTMPLTRESVRNFYDNKAGERGNKWVDAQIEWAAANNKMNIKRVAFINIGDLVDIEFKKSLKNLLCEYDTFCDLRICDIERARTILAEHGFVSRDFGVFIKNAKPTCALFTFISVYQGDSFVKSAGNEYFTRSEEIIDILQRYFYSVWDNDDLEKESDVLMNALGVRNGSEKYTIK